MTASALSLQENVTRDLAACAAGLAFAQDVSGNPRKGLLPAELDRVIALVADFEHLESTEELTAILARAGS